MSNPSTDWSHRSWPPPRSPWVLAMRWNDLAFLHWPVEHDLLRPFVPDVLELETRDGRAWIGVTPLQMAHVRARLTPPLPGISTFPELNLRTYVSVEGKPGVWFFSLDAGSSLAVRTARWTFGLPYFRASMAILRRERDIRYRCSRALDGHGELRFCGSYRPTGPVFNAKPGTVEHWLTERYCLYSLKGGKLYRGEILHEPWPLQPASVEIEENTMAEPLGVALESPPPLVHYARQLDVAAWLPSRVGR